MNLILIQGIWLGIEIVFIGSIIIILWHLASYKNESYCVYPICLNCNNRSEYLVPKGEIISTVEKYECKICGLKALLVDEK